MGTIAATNGAWSVSIASAGCSAAPFNVQTQAISSAATAAASVQSTVSAISATTISGAVTAPATVSLLGVLSLTLASASATVHVEAFCN